MSTEKLFRNKVLYKSANLGSFRRSDFASTAESLCSTSPAVSCTICTPSGTISGCGGGGGGRGARLLEATPGEASSVCKISEVSSTASVTAGGGGGGGGTRREVRRTAVLVVLLVIVGGGGGTLDTAVFAATSESCGCCSPVPVTLTTAGGGGGTALFCSCGGDEDVAVDAEANAGGGGGGGAPTIDTDTRRADGGGGGDAVAGGPSDRGTCSVFCSTSSCFFTSSVSGTTSRVAFATIKEAGREEFALFKVDGVPGADEVTLRLSG